MAEKDFVTPAKKLKREKDPDRLFFLIAYKKLTIAITLSVFLTV